MEKIMVGRGMLTEGAVWLGDEGGMARLRVPVTGGRTGCDLAEGEG